MPTDRRVARRSCRSDSVRQVRGSAGHLFQWSHRLMRPILFLLVPASLLAQAQPVPQTNAKPGWQWTMDTVNTVVNAVRAGRSLQPKAWPNGARVAVLLSFDVDNETIAI